MIRRLKRYLFLFPILIVQVAYAQNYPVRVTPILSPPYTPFLTDYIEAGSDKLALHITLNDVTIPQYRCKLRVTIEGVNISITTNPNFVPLPLTLAGGVPEILYGSDLSEYFKTSNLTFKGMSLEEFEKKGSQLPEGIYRFSFEVLDYNRGTVVSNIGSTTAWMILNDPPIINVPVNNAKLKPLNPQNLVFQWTPRHRGSPNAAFTTEYDVKLVEIWPQGRNPYDAINTSLPIFETTTDNTLVVYGPAETPLVLGREYALQIRARDTGGKDLFKNKGYSEVIRFVYGDECPIPSSLSADEIGTLKARLKWQGSGLNSGYVLRYRERKEGAEWFEKRTDQTYVNATDMKPGTSYEYAVCGECEAFRSEYSKEQLFKTLSENPNDFVCKDPNAIPALDGSPPLPVLMINDTIKAGGFTVIVSQAMGSNGNFTGRGVAIVPWFNSAKVNVTFENISVNKSHQLTRGAINSVWDPTSKFLIDVPNVLSEKGSAQLETLVATFEADSLINVPGVILSVFINPDDNNIVVQTTSGETVIKRSEEKTYAITDQSGNGFLVDKEGKITKTTAEVAATAANRGERNYNTNPNLGLHFVKTSDTRFGFDEQREGTLPQNYQQASNGKSIPWKALSAGQTENLQAVVDGITKAEKIKFKLEGLNTQDLASTPDLQLQLNGQAEGTIEEVLVYYVESDTAKHPPILAKLNTISYNAIQKNLVVVRVNGAPLSIDPPSLREKLNEIYQQAVVSWNTVQLEELNVSGVDTKNLDDGESGLLSNYTADMRAIINAYTANHTLAAETYYLFLVEQARNPTKLGYMPRKKQAGFIFTQPHGNGSDIVVTMAHELAHGAFRLEHTFSEFTALTQGTTDNLMDYNNGTRLNKYQWDNIHNPVTVLGLFEEDEESSLTLYQTDGHYWTVYLVSLMIGIDEGISRILAYQAEYPDGVYTGNRYSERYTWLIKEDQKDTHVLNGRYGPDVTKETIEMIKKVDKFKFEELGRLIHRLGDSFAHRKLDGSNFLYGTEDDELTLEHFLWDFSAPDLIQNRPGLYEEYVNSLADVLIDKFEQAKSVNKIELWKKTHELAMYATINRVSLLGIINYEVARLRKSKTFIVNINLSYFPGQREAHDTYVENTKKYLRERKIKFSTELTTDGTIFKLLD